jgi:hypothetical protein
MSPKTKACKKIAVEMLALAMRDAVAVYAFKKVPEVDFSIIGFHAQQSVEKCLKGVLASIEVEFPRTHELATLHALLISHGVEVPFTSAILDRLTPYAVSSRYDLERDELLDEAQASELVTQVHAWATSKVIPK